MASGPQAYQSTGLWACCSRYGLDSSTRRFVYFHEPSSLCAAPPRARVGRGRHGLCHSADSNEFDGRRHADDRTFPLQSAAISAPLRPPPRLYLEHRPDRSRANRQEDSPSSLNGSGLRAVAWNDPPAQNDRNWYDGVP